MKFLKLPTTTTLFSLALSAGFAAPMTARSAESTVAETTPPVTVKVDKSRPKSFADSPTIIVPTVYLKLPVSGRVFVAKQGSALSTLGGGNANTVRASANYTVQGLDKQLAQQIAKAVYDDFVAKLREAGYTVQTYEDLKDTEAMKQAQREKGDGTWNLPTEKDPSGNALYVVASPSDEQAFKTGMVGGVFNQFMKRGKSTLAGGSILIPTYTIAAPQAWGETGGGYKTISASANVVPGMNLTFAMVSLLTEKGGWGDVRTKEQVINISTKIGELTKQDTTDKAGNALSAGLSVLSGAGRISGNSANYQLVVDPAAYQAGVLNGASAFHVEVAKVAAEARK